MSDIPAPEVKMVEGEPFEGDECEDSAYEYGQQENNDGHFIPTDNLAVEYHEDPEYPSEKTDAVQSANMEEYQEDLYGEGNADNTVYTADMFTQDADNYEDLQKTYIEDFIYDTSFDEGSNSNLEINSSQEDIKGLPLSCFNKITKNVEIAEYETLQVLYQLLYQRSAWDTQEILIKRILEFSGTAGSSTGTEEDNYNRKVMLQTQPNEMLIKIGAILGLDIRMMLFDSQKARSNIITQILEFIASPKKKTRRRGGADVSIPKKTPTSPNICGCRNSCHLKFNEAQKTKILNHMKVLEGKRVLDNYLLHLIQLKKIIRKPGTYEDLKKFKEVNYTYRVKIGKNEAFVCKGAFCTLHGIRITKLVKLQNRLKSGKYSSKANVDHLICSDDESSIIEIATEHKPSLGVPDVSAVSASSSPKRQPAKKKMSLSLKEINQIEDDKDKISRNEATSPKKKFEIISVEDEKPKEFPMKEKKESPDISGTCSIKSEDSDAETSEEESNNDTEHKSINKKRLKEFSLVVKSIDEAPAELLIDVHFLLFLDSAEADKVKEHILNFDGFPFDVDTEEYDERNEFLQRMSNKIITDVSRCLSLGILSTKEDTIKNILSFLMKPDESYLRMSTLPVSLSDVEFDDFGDMSDSDESLTCEVVEKKVECIEIISSGDESDKEDSASKEKISSPKLIKKSPMKQVKNNDPQYIPENKKNQPSVISSINSSLNSITAQPEAAEVSSENQSSSSGNGRTLRDFETICKIVNTHPHEYLVDIYELLYMQKHQPNSLRKDILDFSGFSFEKGHPEYVRRKQFLDRMLYNSVRRIYNTVIHNTTEVKVFSKPTMISEIFQFLFKLPDHDTSIRPTIPVPKPLVNSTPVQQKPININSVIANQAPAVASPPALQLPNQSGKLSDLKRVFQRVACFPCEYLVDVHKLLFMTDCDAQTIRQNIFNFKGFDFGINSQEFQQRKMFLEYLTFHSLRKISSVLTTRSVDLRNSTKHELATHLTQVLAEYCDTFQEKDTEIPVILNQSNSNPIQSQVTSNSPVENIVVTPIIDPSFADMNDDDNSTIVSSSTGVGITADHKNAAKSASPAGNLGISIVDAHSLNSPPVTPVTTTGKSQKRKQGFATILPKTTSTQPAEMGKYADINLPEVEQYRQLYGQNLNLFPNKPNEIILPVECVLNEGEPYAKKAKSRKETSNKSSEDSIHLQSKILRETMDEGDDEDCDKPLASLIGHPIDSVLKKHILDIVEQTDLQEITINGVIQKIFNMYPKFDLSYRKDFIKSTLRSILYRLGNADNSAGTEVGQNSPDCAVTTTGNRE